MTTSAAVPTRSWSSLGIGAVRGTATDLRPAVRKVEWRGPVAQTIVAAALGTDRSTTKVLAEAVLKVAQSTVPQDADVTFLTAPLQPTWRPQGTAEVRTRTASEPANGPVVGDLVGKNLGWMRWMAYRRGPTQAEQTACRPGTNWDVWRPVLSLTFSAVVGLSSTLVPTSASATDSECQTNSATAGCWRAIPEEHVHTNQTVHRH